MGHQALFFLSISCFGLTGQPLFVGSSEPVRVLSFVSFPANTIRLTCTRKPCRCDDAEPRRPFHTIFRHIDRRKPHRFCMHRNTFSTRIFGVKRERDDCQPPFLTEKTLHDLVRKEEAKIDEAEKKGSSPDRRKKSQERAREGTQSVVSQLQIRRRSLGASEAESTGWLRDQDVNLKALHTHDPSMNRMPVFNSMNHRLVNYCSPACRSRNSFLAVERESAAPT